MSVTDNTSMTAPTDGRIARQEVETDLAKFTYEELLEYSEQSTQGTVVKKEDLIGVPFAIYDVSFKSGAQGDYVVVRAKLPTEDLIVFTDGSTGANREVREHIAKGKGWPWVIPGGLRESKYMIPDPQDRRDVPDDQKKQVPASTFYLDAAKPVSEIDFAAAKVAGRKALAQRRA